MRWSLTYASDAFAAVGVASGYCHSPKLCAVAPHVRRVLYQQVECYLGLFVHRAIPHVITLYRLAILVLVATYNGRGIKTDQVARATMVPKEQPIRSVLSDVTSLCPFISTRIAFVSWSNFFWNQIDALFALF